MMVYVFGVEGVPLFEMLFFVVIFMFLALFFVLLELRRLTSILNEEKNVMVRFEKDLELFEEYQDGNAASKKNKDSLNDVKTYIIDAIENGATLIQIESVLIKRGWSKKDIDKIFRSLYAG